MTKTTPEFVVQVNLNVVWLQLFCFRPKKDLKSENHLRCASLVLQCLVHDFDMDILDCYYTLS